MPRWKKLPVSHKSPLESVLEKSRQTSCTVPSLALPPYNLPAAPRQRNMAQMKEQSKTSELSNEEIANLFDGECEALVIKMLTELIELG